jgi:serine/threonine-protein kinase
VLDPTTPIRSGEIFKARHRRSGNIVAIKGTSYRVLDPADASKWFEHQVRRICSLSNNHLVNILDLVDCRGVWCLVTEYVDGEDLERFVRRNGVMPVPSAIECIVQVARGLEYAHARGLFHLDLTPDALLLDRQGVTRVLGTGIAAIEREIWGGLSGHPDYMAPDLLECGGACADIYGLGAVWFYVLSGRPMYHGSGWDALAKLKAHRSEPIPLLPVAESVAGDVNTFFRRMVAKKASDRYPSMAEVLADLQSFQARA